MRPRAPRVRPQPRRRYILTAYLQALFRPRGVAVIGASTRPTALGYAVARNLIRGGYPGAVHLVNPKGGTLLGHPLHPSVLEVPDPVDLAVIIVPAAAVPRVLEEVGQRGITAAIIQAGGFAEVGPEGAMRQQQALEVANRYGIRLLGPNCIGILDTHYPLNTTFLPPPPPKAGHLAFLSQSGALAAAVLDWSLPREEGFSLIVSTGNQADLTITDLLPWVAQDAQTRAILLYLETPPDADLVQALRRARTRKPVIVLQAGRTAAGQRAAASHTAALAGTWALARAAYRRAGVLVAPDVPTALLWARSAIQAPPAPFRPRVAILTNAGGPGVLAADALAEHNLPLATLTAETQSALRHILPPAASVGNPVDMLASASPEQYAASLAVLLDASEVDAVLVILPPPPGYSAGAVARAIIPVAQSHAKPVVVALMGGRLIPEAEAHLRAAGLPVVHFPREAAVTLAGLAAQKRGLAAAQGQPWLPPAPQAAQATAVLQAAPPQTWLSPAQVATVLDAYGIPRIREAYATTPAEAASMATRIGYPVVLKAHAQGLLHKSDAGGVAVGLASAEEVQQTVHAWQNRFGPALQGVVIQALAPPGHEVIVGGLRDARLGPVLMLGSGGVAVEVLEDVAFALAPLTRPDLDALLRETSVGRRLRGYRNLPAVQPDALGEVLARVGRLLVEQPRVAELDLNPLRVTPQGVWVLDARLRVGA